MSNPIIAEYVLVASGSVITPQLNIIIFQSIDEAAKKDASEKVAQLSKAGYFNFTLFNTKEVHVQIAHFTVETPEPIVTVK